MCLVCGCAGGDAGTGKQMSYRRVRPRQTTPVAERVVEVAGNADELHFGHAAAGVHVPGLSQERIIEIETNVMARNNSHADRVRARFSAGGVFALNLVSSPGSGKTSLLVETIKRLGDRFPVAVIEGDQQTSNDAERIRASGARALQINTGKGCHLDAAQIELALDSLGLPERGILFIENVGNLVCPSGFDLGEAHKVVVLSVTEGEDKPLKYPDMFAAADVMLLNKIDLLPHLRFDAELCCEYARRVNPGIRIFRTSVTTGEGFDDWLSWLGEQQASAART